MNINELAKLYVKYGKEKGFREAEFLLMDYLPKDNPFGYCCDVPVSRRKEFADMMQSQLLENVNVTVD